MASVTRFVSDTLRLTVNPLKSAADRPARRKFPGFAVSRNGAKLKVADNAIRKLKDRVRELTRRTRGYRFADIVAELRETLPGWAGFCSCKTCIPALPGGQSVFRHCRSAESSARHRQMDTTQVTLLHLEAMGPSRLPGTAQTRCDRAGSMEHQQIGAWAMAVIKDTGIDHRASIALLHKPGTTNACVTVGIQFVEPPCT